MSDHLAPGISRELFVSALVSSFTKHHETERALLLGTPLEQLSPSDLMHLDEQSLKAMESLSFDFPQPSAAEAHALATALTHFTSAASFEEGKGGQANTPKLKEGSKGNKSRKKESLFAREFTISKGFVDGLLYCAARARPSTPSSSSSGAAVSQEEEDGSEGDASQDVSEGEGSEEGVEKQFREALAPVVGGGSSSLSSDIVSELCALVLVKCVKIVLLSGVSIASSTKTRVDAGVGKVCTGIDDHHHHQLLACRLICDSELENIPLPPPRVEERGGVNNNNNNNNNAGVDGGDEEEEEEEEGGLNKALPGDDILRKGTNTGAASTHAVVEDEEEDEEEVWASELDDDDVPYEAIDPSVVAQMNSKAAIQQQAEAASGGKGEGVVVDDKQLQLRLAYLVQAFSSSLLSSLPLSSWTRLDLAHDIGLIVKLLLKHVIRITQEKKKETTTTEDDDGQKGGRKGGKGNDNDDDDDTQRTTVSTAAAAKAAVKAAAEEDEDEEVILERRRSAQMWSVLEEGWVAYAYSLRDHLAALLASSISTSCTVGDVRTPLNVIFSLMDDDEDEDDEDDYTKKVDKAGASLSLSSSSSSSSSPPNDGDGVLSSHPGRCVALLVTQSLIRTAAATTTAASSLSSSASSLLLTEVRSLLLQRLVLLSTCVEEVTEATTNALGGGKGVQDEKEGGGEKQRALALATEQGKTILACVGLACGVILHPNTATAANTTDTASSSNHHHQTTTTTTTTTTELDSLGFTVVSAFPPTDQLLKTTSTPPPPPSPLSSSSSSLSSPPPSPPSSSSQSSSLSRCLLRDLLKMLATTTATTSTITPTTTAFQPHLASSSSSSLNACQQQQPQCLRLVAALVLQDGRLCDYALCSPSTVRALAPLQSSLLLLRNHSAVEATTTPSRLYPSLVLLCLSLAVGSTSPPPSQSRHGGGGDESAALPLSERVNEMAKQACEALQNDHLHALRCNSSSLSASSTTAPITPSLGGNTALTAAAAAAVAKIPNSSVSATAPIAVGLSGAVVLAACLGRFPPRTLVRIKQWMASSSNGWFRSWLANLQTELLLSKQHRVGVPVGVMAGDDISGETSRGAGAAAAGGAGAGTGAAANAGGKKGLQEEEPEQQEHKGSKSIQNLGATAGEEQQDQGDTTADNNSDDDEMAQEKAVRQKVSSGKCMSQAAVAAQHDAIKVIKVLLETSAGGNKTD